MLGGRDWKYEGPAKRSGLQLGRRNPADRNRARGGESLNPCFLFTDAEICVDVKVQHETMSLYPCIYGGETMQPPPKDPVRTAL